MPQSVYNDYVNQAKQAGFAVEKLIKVSHESE
jgi:lipocalin